MCRCTFSFNLEIVLTTKSFLERQFSQSTVDSALHGNARSSITMGTTLTTSQMIHHHDASLSMQQTAVLSLHTAGLLVAFYCHVSVISQT